MSAEHLPGLFFEATDAYSPRYGHPIELIPVHRWGVRYSSASAEAASYRGVISYFKDRRHEASAHLIYPGSAVPDHCTQMVPAARAAWAESLYNPYCFEVESADAIWLGKDPAGFAQLARIVAYLLHLYGLPAKWVQPKRPGDRYRGFCRHADLGAAGGGHTACPTTDLLLWHEFCGRVAAEHTRGGFRDRWLIR